MNKELCGVTGGNSQIVATAIHNGHQLREGLIPNLLITEADRLREEDPYTGIWTDIAKTTIVGEYSRFQVDLNRPREKAVYIKPEDSWGLTVWKEEPPMDLIATSLREYDKFYESVHELLKKLVERLGVIVVIDLHTYNHRRDGKNGLPANADENPEVNIGTGSMDRERWSPIVDRFIRDLSHFDFMGRELDVRENIKFRGGQFSRWIHQNFSTSVCSIAVEVKKFFMDEWTGELENTVFESVHNALASTIPGILDELEKTKTK